MSDVLDANGLQVKTSTEITADLNSGFETIYGADINLDSNSADGQVVGIMTQMAVDIRELLVGVNNSFDPDQAVGVQLDQRVALNNIQRRAGSYTVIPVTITANATVPLQGLDANFNDPTATGYSIQDSSGNVFILVNTLTVTPGPQITNFRAKNIGVVNVGLNTVTIPVTVVPGVVSVTNASAAITDGENEETDPQLRTRRQASVASAAAGYLNGLQGYLAGLTGVTDAKVYENFTDDFDINNIPPHAIWVVVAGGSSADIGNAIYIKKSAGANMRGSQMVDILTPSGVIFTAQYDQPTAQTLYMRFTIKRTVPNFAFNELGIKNYMADRLNYQIGAFAETSQPTTLAIAAIANFGGGGVPVLLQVSPDEVNWSEFVIPNSLATQFTIDPANITITVE